MTSSTPRSRIRGLYAIADSHYLKPADFVPAVAAALTGGARVIQLRAKQLDATVRERIARDLVALCADHGAPFLINDDVALAAAVRASGVHLGRDDADIASARGALGANALIGVSCYNELERARLAARAGADYVAFGRFFPSRTKPEAVAASLDLLRGARAALSLPIVAIGGITPENGGSLVAAGADALAVIEGVFNQPDIRAAAARYARLFASTAESP